MQKWFHGSLVLALSLGIFASGCNNTAEPPKPQPTNVSPPVTTKSAKVQGKPKVKNPQFRHFQPPTH